jgi:hypothetical protein
MMPEVFEERIKERNLRQYTLTWFYGYESGQSGTGMV